jgi:hypothetical protein
MKSTEIFTKYKSIAIPTTIVITALSILYGIPTILKITKQYMNIRSAIKETKKNAIDKASDLQYVKPDEYAIVSNNADIDDVDPYGTNIINGGNKRKYNRTVSHHSAIIKKINKRNKSHSRNSCQHK